MRQAHQDKPADWINADIECSCKDETIRRCRKQADTDDFVDTAIPSAVRGSTDALGQSR